MKRNLLYLFLLVGMTVSAKHLTVADPNFETKLKEKNSSTINGCMLNVILGSTLDIPTSSYFVDNGQLNGTAPYTYFLDGELNTNVNVFYVSNLNPGTHTVTVQDANGCTGSTTFVVQTSPLSITTTVKNPTCIESGSITCAAIGGVGPYTYSISFNGSPFSPVSSPSYDTFTFGPMPGIYQIQITDAGGSTSNTVAELISPTPISVTTIHTNVTCHGDNNGTIHVTIDGGAAPYYFSIDNGSLLLTSNVAFSITGLSTGFHTIVVKDSNGCTTETSVTIGEPTVLTATAIITKALDCTSGAYVTCAATGGTAPYTYSINGGSSFQASSLFSLPAGIYSIIVKDSNGCVSYTSTITVTEPTPLTPTITATNITCNGLNNGRISIIAKGGAAPYMFSIDNGVTFTSYPEFNNLSAGTYDVIVKDANGCNYTETIIITEPEALSATVFIENQAITVNATGGTGGYTYSFDGVTFTPTNLFTGLGYGSYNIYIKDSNGCAFSIDVTVNPPAPLLNGEKTLAIQFTPGQTLEDIIVDGQNIKWYSNPGTSNNKSQAPEATLPLDTELVDNTTYYASQTINGYESTERLAVTTKLSLSTADYTLPDFKFYPNPVKNSLTISNTSTIDEVVFISVKGDVLLTKQINSTDAVIDLSSFSKGLYFLKIKAEGTEKTIKIIKE